MARKPYINWSVGAKTLNMSPWSLRVQGQLWIPDACNSEKLFRVLARPWRCLVESFWWEPLLWFLSSEPWRVSATIEVAVLIIHMYMYIYTYVLTPPKMPNIVNAILPTLSSLWPICWALWRSRCAYTYVYTYIYMCIHIYIHAQLLCVYIYIYAE